MSIFNEWCQFQKEENGNKTLYKSTELPGGRTKVSARFIETVRSHYDDLARIADDIAENGYVQAAKILKARLPVNKQVRSGELGEILATEFVESYLDHIVPIRRLKFKDNRDMALRGDDFIGFSKDPVNDLRIIKGESKSRQDLSVAVLTSARKALNKNHGRCTPISLLFVADQLLKQGGQHEVLGKILKKQIATPSLTSDKISHMIFTLSGNQPLDDLRNDLNKTSKNRPQISVNMHITDHQKFISTTYKKVANLGK